MKELKVLDTGCCGSSRKIVALIEQVAREKGVSVKLQKVSELRDIASFGVMSTPGLVIDGKLVHQGGVPSNDQIERWLSEGEVLLSDRSLPTGQSSS